MESLMTLKDFFLLNIRDYMKTESSGCGMWDSDCISRFKELPSINGSALTYITVINFSQWLFKTKSKEKTTNVERQS